MGQVQVVGLGMAALDLILRTKEMPTWHGGVRVQVHAAQRPARHPDV